MSKTHQPTRLALAAAVLVALVLAVLPAFRSMAQDANPTLTPAGGSTELNQEPAQPTKLGPAVPPELTEYANDWPAMQGNLSGTRAAADSAINSGNVSKLGVAWRFPIKAAGAFGGMTATPLVTDDTVYVQDMESNVFALARETGQIKWETDYNLSTIGPNGLALGYGMLYAPLGDTSEIAAVNAKTGKEVWRVKLSDNPGAGIDMTPTVYDSTVYVSTVPGNSKNFYRGGTKGIFYALDAKTGDILWEFDTTNNLWGNPRLNTGGGLWYPPSIDDKGNIYFGTGNPGPWPGTSEYPNGTSRPGDDDYASSMVSLNPKTGAIRWFVNARPHDLFDLDFQLTPILVTTKVDGRDRLVAIGGGKAGKVIAADAESGKVLWTAKVGKHENDDLTKIENGKTVTVYPGDLGGIETPMAYADGMIYVPIVDNPNSYTSTGLASQQSDLTKAKGELVALNVSDGKVVWKVDLPQMALAGATVANDVVFTGALDGVFRAYDAKTGKELWTYQSGTGFNASPAIAGDMIFVAVAGPLLSSDQSSGESAELIAFKLGATGTETPSATVSATVSGSATTPSATVSPATPTISASPSPASPTSEASPGASPVASPSGTTIDLFEFGFKPNAITIPANTPVTFTLKNTGVTIHNFNIDQLNVHSPNINPGQSVTVTINAPAGTYQFYCNIPGHKEAGMVGTLTVK